MGQAVIALRVVESARDEAREHAPVLVARFEQTEGERLAFRAFVGRADGLEQLGQAFGDGAVAGDGAIAAATGSESLRRRREDKLEGHQRTEVSEEGNIAGEAMCISQ